MNKGVLIGVVAVVVLVVAGWWVFGKGASGGPAAAELSQQQSGGIAQLMAQGNSECTVTSEMGGITSSGTMYVADGKVRGTFTSSGAQTGTMDSNMIVRDGFVYVWSSAMPQGIKMAAQASGATATDGQPNPYDANYNYNCTSWSPDESQFALPSGITFTDFSAAAGASAGAAGGPTCAQCDMVPAGPSRDQCKVALKCQ